MRSYRGKPRRRQKIEHTPAGAGIGAGHGRVSVAFPHLRRAAGSACPARMRPKRQVRTPPIARPGARAASIDYNVGICAEAS